MELNSGPISSRIRIPSKVVHVIEKKRERKEKEKKRVSIEFNFQSYQVHSSTTGPVPRSSLGTWEPKTGHSPDSNRTQEILLSRW